MISRIPRLMRINDTAYFARKMFSPRSVADMITPNTVISRLKDETSETGKYRSGSIDSVYATAEIIISRRSVITAHKLIVRMRPPKSDHVKYIV